MLTIFPIESQDRISRIAIAKVTNDKIEILAEQLLPMSLEAATYPQNISLKEKIEEAIERLRQKTNQENKYDILLYDPKLTGDLDSFKELGEKWGGLQPDKLQADIKELSKEDVNQLLQWIEKPKKIKLSPSRLKEDLVKRQKMLSRAVSKDKALLISLLELSLALNNKY